MKAFVGHSFDDRDQPLVDKIISFLSKRDIVCETGEKAQNKSVSEKVKERIVRNEIFIGIFTIDKEIILDDYMKQNKIVSFIKKFNLKKSKSEEPKRAFSTSNWVIQESGYALGKDKEAIFLVEENIYKFPELQGDKELIYFSRDNLDPLLLKLSEVAQDIKSRSQVGMQVVSQPLPEPKEDQKLEDMKETEKKKKLLFNEMFDAYEQGDIKKADEIYQNKIRKELDEEKILFWDAIILYWEYCAGDAEALTALEKLAADKKNPDIERQLAHSYEFGDKNEEARKSYLRGIGYTEDVAEKVGFLINIAKSYARERNYLQALETLLGAVNNSSYNKYSEKIFAALVKIAESKKDDDLYFLFSEKLLEVNPVNTAMRFNLAYKYGSLDENQLAIYHYKKLLSINEDAVALNNIGVEYSGLEMKAKGVPYYERAKAKKNTLAYANIAYKYLNEGFTDAAEKLLKEADGLSQEGIEVHPNIGYAKKKLKDIQEEENEKEKKVLDLAEDIHNFKVRHANAYCFKPLVQIKPEISGKWTIDNKWDVIFHFDAGSNMFSGTCSFEIEETQPLLAAYWLGTSEKKYKIVNVEIKGSINNSSGKYEVRVTEKKKTTTSGLSGSASSLLTPEDSYSAKGLLIISNNGTAIDFFEHDNKNNRHFGKWNKKL